MNQITPLLCLLIYNKSKKNNINGRSNRIETDYKIVKYKSNFYYVQQKWTKSNVVNISICGVPNKLGKLKIYNDYNHNWWPLDKNRTNNMLLFMMNTNDKK